MAAARRLWSSGSVVTAHRLLLCALWGLPRPGVTTASPASAGRLDSSPVSHQGSPEPVSFITPVSLGLCPLPAWQRASLPVQPVKTACNAGDLSLIPGLGRPPGEGKGYHSSILAWRITWTVQSMLSQSRTRLSDFTTWHRIVIVQSLSRV